MRYLLPLFLVACGRTGLHTDQATESVEVWPVDVAQEAPKESGAPCDVIFVGIQFAPTGVDECLVGPVEMTRSQYDAMVRAYPSCQAYRFRGQPGIDCVEAGVIPAGANPGRCDWTTPQHVCDSL